MSASRGKQSALPPMSDVAADLRDGADLGDLAAALGVTREHLRYRLNEAGWGTRGVAFADGAREVPLPTFVRGDLTWMDDAVCASTDPALFFPASGVVPAAALRVCAGCPVKQKCLDYSLDNGFDDGLFGGVVPRKRKKLRKGQAA